MLLFFPHISITYNWGLYYIVMAINKYLFPIPHLIIHALFYSKTITKVDFTPYLDAIIKNTFFDVFLRKNFLNTA